MRLLEGLLKNRNVLICVIIGLFSCDSAPGKIVAKPQIQRQIAPNISCPLCKDKKAAGFVLWLSQNADYAALVVFDKDTNGDGKVVAKVGEHGELLEDMGTIAWVNTFSQEITLYDSFLGSDPTNRLALLKKADEIFLFNTTAGTRVKLEGAQANPDSNNPCLPSREAALSINGDRVVYPIGPNAYRSVLLENSKTYDVNSESLLWRVRPFGNGEEVFEIVKDRDADGLAFPKSQSTCACTWCPRFARSVGSYGSVGDEIRKSVYQNGKRLPVIKSHDGCKEVGSNEGAFNLLECGHTLYRNDKVRGVKSRILHKIKIPSYENPTLNGWFPVLVLGEEGMHMGRYNIETNVLERGPQVNRYAKKTHSNGFWLGRSKSKNIVWSLRSNQFKTIKGLGDVTTFDGLVANTKTGKYIVDAFTGAVQKIDEAPTWSTSNGCALFRKQTHRITVGPWKLSCP